jgi:hypothetical protein
MATEAERWVTRDPWIAANQMVNLSGDEAAVIAAHHADALWWLGDEEGCSVWKRILSAISELTSTELHGAVN